MATALQRAGATPDALTSAFTKVRGGSRVTNEDPESTYQALEKYGVDLTQQAISQHLTVLKRAGLLAERREGTRRLYSLRSESLQPLRSLLDEFWPDALARLKQSVERAHPRTERSRPT